MIKSIQYTAFDLDVITFYSFFPKVFIHLFCITLPEFFEVTFGFCIFQSEIKTKIKILDLKTRIVKCHAQTSINGNVSRYRSICDNDRVCYIITILDRVQEISYCIIISALPLFSLSAENFLLTLNTKSNCITFNMIIYAIQE